MMIACVTNEDYAEMAGVLLRSIARNGEVGDTAVVLVGDGLTAATVQALEECAEGLCYRFIDLAARGAIIRDLPVTWHDCAIYIRLLLPDLIEGRRRLLYLDADMLVHRTLRPLLECSLGAHPVAAVPDCGGTKVYEVANAKLGRAPDRLYFNSGMLLMNLDEWRDRRLGHACIRFAQARDDYWPDQDAINSVLDGQIMELEPKWNFFSHGRLPREAFDAAHILHFIPEKPLSMACRHPMFEDYLALRATTPWRDRPLPATSPDRRIKMLLEKAATRIKQHRERSQTSKA